jgi:FixJ family two-component response regulator
VNPKVTAGASIAVVDDEIGVRRALDRLLRASGYRVDTFATGAEFLGALIGHTPACAVLDLHMPDLDGFELQTLLTKAGRRIPVIIITGHDTPANRARALELGARAYLCKPVDANELIGAIEAQIGRA